MNLVWKFCLDRSLFNSSVARSGGCWAQELRKLTDQRRDLKDLLPHCVLKGLTTVDETLLSG